MSESTRGRLLVASPVMEDPNFHRTVVLMLDHSDEGAFGLVLNRPTFIEAIDAIPSWGPFVADPALVFNGGPVNPAGAIGLGRAAATDSAREGSDAPDGWLPILDGYGTIDLAKEPEELGVVLERLRVFVGYAGWAGGQLESEIAQAGWMVLDAEPDDAFSDEPSQLWRTVLKRQRGRTSWLANFPIEPSLN